MRNLVRTQGGEQIDLCKTGPFGLPVGKIYDFSLSGSFDCRMRIIDEARQPF